MSMTIDGQMTTDRRSLRGTPIEFRLVYSVAFAAACLSGLTGSRAHDGPLLSEARTIAWNTALNTIPQTPFG